MWINKLNHYSQSKTQVHGTSPDNLDCSWEQWFAPCSQGGDPGPRGDCHCADSVSAESLQRWSEGYDEPAIDIIVQWGYTSTTAQISVKLHSIFKFIFPTALSAVLRNMSTFIYLSWTAVSPFGCITWICQILQSKTNVWTDDTKYIETSDPDYQIL